MTDAGVSRGAPRLPLWVRIDAAASRLRWIAHRAQNRGLRRQSYVRVGARGHWIAADPAELSIGRFGAIGSDHTVIVAGTLRIGENFFANRGFHLSCNDRVIIGDSVRFGERVSIHDENHVFEPVGADRGEYTTSAVLIGDRVWLGANTTVAGGARIGADAVIGANSVVTGEIPAGVLAAGVPARVIRNLRSE